MKEREIQLLKNLQKKLKEWEIDSLYRDSSKEQIPTDILTGLITEFGNSQEEVLAEFFFMPEVDGQEADGLYFHSVITLSERVTEDMLPSLYEATAILNCFAETGTFAVTKAGNTLIYRNSVAMPPTIPDEDAAKLIEANTMFAINVSEQFIDALFKVADGRMSMEEFRGILPD